MSPINPVPTRMIVNKAKYVKGKTSIFKWILLIICSPVLLIFDLFRPLGSKKVLQAYLWLMFILFLLSVMFYFLTEAKSEHLEKLLGEYCSYSADEAVLSVSTELQEIIYGNAIMANISPQLVTAVIQVESSFRPTVRSPKGACGLMQITPLVWRHYNPNSQCDGKHLPGKANHGKDCIYDVESNIATGVRYLKDLITNYDGEIGRALEAYNAGLTNVDLEKLKPKYQETRVYLQRIGSLLASDHREQFADEYNFNLFYKTTLRWILFSLLFLWALLLVWIYKRCEVVAHAGYRTHT